MGVKMFISTLLILLNLSATAGNAGAAGDNIVHQSNSSYTVFIDHEKCLVALDTNINKTTRIEFDTIIHRLTICPTAPFVSFSGTEIKNGVPRDTRLYIYDIHAGKLYNGQYFLDLDEFRWSPSGKYTYFNMHERLILVPTVELAAWLESSERVENIYTIIGHPLGYMWQIAWIGDNLLYGNGIGDMECWGLFNTDNGLNQFISCCGVNGGVPCDANARKDTEIIKTLALKAQEGKLRAISNDFYEEVQRITTSSENRESP